MAALLAPGTACAGQPVTQTLNPPPLSFETGKTAGNGVICDGSRTESSGQDDTGIAVLQASDRFGIPRERLMDSRWLGPAGPSGKRHRPVLHRPAAGHGPGVPRTATEALE